MSHRGNMTCLGSFSREHADDERSSHGRASGKNSSGGTLDELNFAHIFDYNAIEQIANGLEKMVQSWSSAQEERAQEYARVSVSLEDDSPTKQLSDAINVNVHKVDKDDYVDISATNRSRFKNFSRFPAAEKKAAPAKAPCWENEPSVSDFSQILDRQSLPQVAKLSSPAPRVGTGTSSNRISGGFQKPPASSEKESCSARVESRSSKPQDANPFTPRKSSPEVVSKTSSPSRSEVSPRRNLLSHPAVGESSPRRKSSSHPPIGESNPRRNLVTHPPVGESSPKKKFVRHFPPREGSPKRNFARLPTGEVSPKRKLSCQPHSPRRNKELQGTSFASHSEQHQHFQTMDTTSKSSMQPRNGCESYSDVEMQKVYIDVASNLERSFSQREYSTTEKNPLDTVTKLFQDHPKHSSEQKNGVSIWFHEPKEDITLKDHTPPSNGGLSRDLSPQIDSLLEIQKDFARGAAALERKGSESAGGKASLRESLELQNSSTLISTRYGGDDLDGSHASNHINFQDTESFTGEKVPELREDLNGRFPAASSPGTKKDDSSELEQARYPSPQQNEEESEHADDAFITSSSYWRVEPEPLHAETGEKQQECSFVNDTLYEKVDFTTERPLKRKKEALEVVRTVGGYESEFETHESGDITFLVDTGQPAISETIIFAEDCFEVPSKQLHSFGKSFPAPIQPDVDDSKEAYKIKVEELQIALLECAAEYEVKMVEMEMKMLQLKSRYQVLEQEPAQAQTVQSEKEFSTKRLENYRKQNLKLQREKEMLSRDMVELKKKERPLDLLRKNLEDSLQKVNSLQRELVKKEEELVDSQLKEKEAKAHVYQVEAALQQAEASQLDQSCVFDLLMALGQWLQSVKKFLQQAGLVKFDPRHQLQIQQYEDSLAKLLDEYVPQKVLEKQMLRIAESQNRLNGEFKGGFVGYLEDAPLIHQSPPLQQLQQQDCRGIPLPEIRRDKEVQALETELERLACRRATF